MDLYQNQMVRWESLRGLAPILIESRGPTATDKRLALDAVCV